MNDGYAIILGIFGVLATACGAESSKTTPPPATDALLDGPALTRRLSMDLRGIPPTLDELVRAEEDGWQSIVDEYLADPLLEERLVHLYAQTWHTRVDVFDIVVLDYGLDDSREYSFERAIGEEPLRLLARVITEDMAWSEVVLADWTMANDTLLSVWPLEPEASATGWQVARYTDGRPPVGVLATNGLWWRYTTTSSNMNRGRAAAISRLLLCEDYFVRPVSFAEADTIGVDTEDAAQSDPYCLACHASLDPVAAALFGFWWLAQYSEIEETTYHPEREALWEHTLGVEPAWYGTPISGLADLGWSVANDSRFTTCAVETLAQGLWQRDVTADDVAELEALRQVLLRADTRIKPLIAAVTATDAYRDPTPRMLAPDQLATSLQATTGFSWTADDRNLLDTDDLGFRQLLGGVDGEAITSPQREPGLTWALATARAAEGAADYAVRIELVEEGPRTLFRDVTLDDRPGEALFIAELNHLHERLLSTPATDEWRTDVSALWTAVEAETDTATAWKALVTVLLRDPAFLSY